MIDIFNAWRLPKKLLVSFSVIAIILTVVAGAGIYATQTMSNTASAHVSRGLAGTEALGSLTAELRERRVIIWSMMSANSAQERREYIERYKKTDGAIEEALARYQPLAQEFGPQFDTLKADIAALDKVNERIIATYDANGAGAALPLVSGEGRTASRTAVDQADALIALQKKRAQTNDAAGNAFAAKAFTFLVTLSMLGMGMLFAIWKLLGKTVSKPMSELSNATTALAAGGKASVPHQDRLDELGDVAKAVEMFRVAAVERAESDAKSAAEQQIVTTSLSESLQALKNGDLTVDIQATFPTAYGELKVNFNEALASLRELIASVIESAATIQTGSGEIAQASEDLARRTEANAASLEETSAAITQIDDRLGASAKAAAKTVQRADGAISTVNTGRTVADEAVQAMTRVSDSAKGIDDVIEGLDKIAFQTRVLAMNAAVEAGRAGEAGRGFAVVADLVSALAMRAEEEAGRAREQLTATQADVSVAVEMVQKVDGALNDIAGDVTEVHTLLGNMAADNQAQSTAITQISVAIGSMDQSTQQNAAMVEQTSAAARNLSHEVSSLTDRASRFEVGKVAFHNAPRAPVLAAPARPKPVAAKPDRAPIKAVVAAKANGVLESTDWTEF